MDEPQRLVGEFVAANSETRGAVGDVTIQENTMTFSSGMVWELDYLDKTKVAFGGRSDQPELPPLPLFANRDGHWAEKSRVRKARTPKGARSIAWPNSIVIVQFDLPNTSIQINVVTKSLFSKSRLSPNLVFLTPAQLERWRVQQLS